MSASSSVQIRPAQRSDASVLGRMGAALARLHHAFDPARFMFHDGMEDGYRNWLSREMQQASAVVLVAEVEGSVVGYAYGRMEARDWNALLDAHGGFHDIWVEPSMRQNGVGVALAEAMMKALVQLGAPRVVLKTAAPNAAAQKLFARLGWRNTMIEMTRECAEPTEPAPGA